MLTLAIVSFCLLSRAAPCKRLSVEQATEVATFRAKGFAKTRGLAAPPVLKSISRDVVDERAFLVYFSFGGDCVLNIVVTPCGVADTGGVSGTCV